MSYNGIVAEIPVGSGGLTGSKNQVSISPDQLIIANGVSYANGNLSKEGGAAKYNAVAISGAPAIIGGCDWWPDSTTQRMIVATDAGKVLRDDGLGTFPTTLATALVTAGCFVQFVEGGAEAAGSNKKLFMFTGTNPVKVLSGDGATMTTISGGPTDWSSPPSCGCNHENRLWGAGNANDPHRLYYSLPTNHETFTGTGAGTISIYPGEGERIAGMVSFKGLLVVSKYPKGIYLVDTSNPDTTKWRAQRMTPSVGWVSPEAAVVIDDDIVFADATGNYQLLSAVTEFGDMANRNLSSQLKIDEFMRKNVNFSQIRKTRAVYYAHKREVHFCLPGLSSVALNRRMTIDQNGQQPRFRFSDRDTNHCIWLRKDITGLLRMMIGENGGFVYQLDQDVKSKDGQAYTSTFQTAHMDFSWKDPALATKDKIGEFLEIIVEPTGDWALSVDYLWDNVYAGTVYFNLGSAGSKLGDFTLGTDKLGSGALLNRRERITGTGHRLSLIARNSAAGQDFSISRFFVYMKIGDEKTNQGT